VADVIGHQGGAFTLCVGAHARRDAETDLALAETDREASNASDATAPNVSIRLRGLEPATVTLARITRAQGCSGSRSVDEVVVGRQQRQPMADAKLCQQRIDGAQPHAGAAAAIAQFGGVDMVLPVGVEQRQRGKPFDDVLACARSGETPQQFLQHQPRGDDDLVALQGGAQRLDLRHVAIAVAAQGQRPDTGADEQGHLRERSAL
jgi:hypothetical protein